jgi:hypothetical protein
MGGIVHCKESKVSKFKVSKVSKLKPKAESKANTVAVLLQDVSVTVLTCETIETCDACETSLC